MADIARPLSKPKSSHSLMSSAKAMVRRAQASMHRAWRAKAAKSRFFASLYYAFVNHELSRESMAVAAGQHAYAQTKAAGKASYFHLRRNIHRLEKGLIMRPRRPVFATDFIGETVDVFDRAMRDATLPLGSDLVWARDVLAQYFAAVDVTEPRIAKAYRLHQEIVARDGIKTDEPRLVPFHRDLDRPPTVGFDAFMALSRRRRSVRWYEDQPVPREMIDRALEAAAQAPSACNRQPYVFRIFDDKERARSIAAIPMGTKGFAEHLPAVAVLVGQLRAYPHERDRHAIYIDGSLAAMSFIYALETMGLASCAINWPDQEPHESKMKKAIGLADDERVIMLIAFGWPDKSGMVPFSSKRPIEEVRVYN